MWAGPQAPLPLAAGWRGPQVHWPSLQREGAEGRVSVPPAPPCNWLPPSLKRSHTICLVSRFKDGSSLPQPSDLLHKGALVGPEALQHPRWVFLCPAHSRANSSLNKLFSKYTNLTRSCVSRCAPDWSRPLFL